MSRRSPAFVLPLLALACAHTSMVAEPSTPGPSSQAASPPPAAAPLAQQWPDSMPHVGDADPPADEASLPSSPVEPPGADSMPSQAEPVCPAVPPKAIPASVHVSHADIPGGAECREALDRLELRHTTFGESSELVVLRHDSIGGIRFRGLDGASLVADCRLLLAFARIAPVLVQAGVSEIRYSGAYSYRMSRTGRLSLHAYGLAIDVHAMVVDGQLLAVERDYRRGLLGCPCAGQPPLNRVACNLRTAHLFRELLTPDYDADHRNHFHLGLAPGKTDRPIPMVARPKAPPPARSQVARESADDDGGWFDPPARATPPVLTPHHASPSARAHPQPSTTKSHPRAVTAPGNSPKPHRAKSSAPKVPPAARNDKPLAG